VLNTMPPEMLEGVMSAVANWGTKGQEELIERLNTVYGEPWMTQNAVSTYGDIWLFKEALEKSCSRDRAALGDALRVMAKENRDLRMSEAEKKAAALPAKLTVPMIVFFLPVLFLVVLGPAYIKYQKMQGKNEAAPALTNERSNDRRSDAGGLMGLDPRVEVRVVA